MIAVLKSIICSRVGGGGYSPIKVGTDLRAQALGISGVNFYPSIRFLGGKFYPGIRFLHFLTKKCVIFDKRVKKVTHLQKNFNFGILKFMKTFPVIGFLGTFLPEH